MSVWLDSICSFYSSIFSLPHVGCVISFSTKVCLHLQVSMKTEITWIRDMLRGDDAFELQVKLLKQVPEEYPYKDDE